MQFGVSMPEKCFCYRLISEMKRVMFDSWEEMEVGESFRSDGWMTGVWRETPVILFSVSENEQ